MVMGGETEKDVSAWTTDSLKELIESQIQLLIVANNDRLGLIQSHFEARIDNFEKRLLERQESQETAIEQVRRETARMLADADKAILKSEAAAEKRFESVNEFRAQLADQASTFQRADAARLSADAAKTEVGGVKDRLDKVERFIAEERGRDTGGKDTAAEQRAREAEERARKAEDGRRTLLYISIAGFIITVVLFANGVFGR